MAIKLKRGDTFSYTATWEGAVLSELKSQVRTNSGELISTVTITSTGTANTFLFKVADTTAWPVGELVTDIQRESGGLILSSDTMYIKVVKDVTQL